MKALVLGLLVSLAASGASLFECVETMSFPTLQSGAMRYDWVEAEGGRGRVVVEFVVGTSRRAEKITVQTLSYEFGLRRWVERYLSKSTFRATCRGMHIKIQYTIVVHRKSSGYDLPMMTIGPGNHVLLEFLEDVGSAPFITNRPTN